MPVSRWFSQAAEGDIQGIVVNAEGQLKAQATIRAVNVDTGFTRTAITAADGTFNYKDEYREGLQRIIEAKIAGEEIVAPAVETPPRVVKLMEALKKSLDAVSTTKKKPAKAAVAQPAAKRKPA